MAISWAGLAKHHESFADRKWLVVDLPFRRHVKQYCTRWLLSPAVQADAFETGKDPQV
ncbi:hypothetical protein K443DRAFT_678090, partial [Laccaria amethystina LaAM-08-1]